MSFVRFAIFGFILGATSALSACASAPSPVPQLAKAPVRRQLVVGTKNDQSLAAQRFCGDESWSLESRGFDGTESYVTCSGHN